MENSVQTIVLNADGTESVENVPVMSLNETNAFSSDSVKSINRVNLKNKLKGFKPKTRF